MRDQPMIDVSPAMPPAGATKFRAFPALKAGEPRVDHRLERVWLTREGLQFRAGFQKAMHLLNSGKMKTRESPFAAGEPQFQTDPRLIEYEYVQEILTQTEKHDAGNGDEIIVVRETMWLSLEEMTDALGPCKVQGLLASGKLMTRPCLMTGSAQEHLVRYRHTAESVFHCRCVLA